MTEEQAYLISGVPDRDSLVAALSETLGVTFREDADGLSGEAFGGLEFDLRPAQESPDISAYLLRCTFDTAHPLFAKQQKHFCRIDELQGLLEIGLRAHAMRVTPTIDQQGPR